MASAKQDFGRFVRWLYQPEREAPVDVRRLANLVLANFDVVAGTSRQHNQRSTCLVRLMRRHFAQIADEAPAAEAEVERDAWPWVRLKHLTLGPFRGFRTPEPFDLGKQIILFYGPNGSGKTSLCEALEYALLGDVGEAGTKRIAARVYLANVHAGRFEAPVLTATDRHNREVDIIADPDSYRFCFVEKNRIEAFSRIAARPNAQRAELIATLFGMDQFNDFASRFNESIDGQLVLIGERQNTLIARRAALAADQAAVEGEAEAFQKLDTEETELAKAYAADMTYAGLKQLIGSADAPGRLQALDDMLETVPPAIIGVTSQNLRDAFENAHRKQNELNDITAALRAQSDEVSFKGLYEVVLALQRTVGDRCPACDTPLTGPGHVANNPFDKATAGLRQLEALGQLQENQRSTQTEVERASRELRRILGRLATFLAAQPEEDTPAGRYLAGLPEEPTGVWWTRIYPPQDTADPDAPSFDELQAIAERITTQDTASRIAQQDRQPHLAERRRLGEFQLKVQAQDLKRQQLREAIDIATARIHAFDNANADLLAQAE